MSSPTPHDQKDAERAVAASEAQEIEEPDATPEPVYSVFSDSEKKLYAWLASLGAFASPVSSAIYYPAITSLARDLDTSIGHINLTITTYMIFQAVTPTFVGGLSDRWGRRPAFIACFVIFIGANTGLALQNSYVALLVLRCLQSAGSSGTVALSNGVVSDLAVRSERGKYIGLASLGSSLGPTLGPLIGGLLNHFLGWRSIFWFLDVYAGVMIVVMLVVFPETCRNIVGDGSVPPQRWNYSLLSYLSRRRKVKQGWGVNIGTVSNKHRASILSSLYIVCSKEAFCLLLYTGLLYAGLYIVIAGLATQLQATFSYNSIQVGLCYIPMGAGAIAARQISGRLIDRNFARHAKRLGVTISKAHQTDITSFPAEQARLEVALPMAYTGCGLMLAYGWILNMRQPPLAAVLVLLFLLILCLASAIQAVSTLLIDCHPDSPSAASAANNLLRCALGAAGIAVWQPAHDAIGIGWTSTLITGVWLLFSALWWMPWFWGMHWRKERSDKVDSVKTRREVEKEKEKEKEKSEA